MRSLIPPMLLLSSLSACGGDGGPTPAPTPLPTPTPTPTPANSPPAFTSPGTASVVENSTIAYQAAASDPDGNPLAYSVSGGPDAARFTIDGTGRLSFVAPPDFENPTDADRNNVYQVTLRVSDGTASATLDLQITVTNSGDGFTVRRVANGFNSSTQVAAVPGQPTQLYVIEKGGRVYLLDTVTGNKTLLITLTNLSTENERGLVGIAVGKAGPGGASAANALFLLATAADGTVEVRVFEQQANGGFVAAANQPVLVSVPHAERANHNGGFIAFGPDGQLYVGIGDGGNGNADFSSQNTASRLGKILRLKRIPNAGTNGPYWQASPDNASTGDPYIFALGFRNPFRGAFEGNDLVIADVGEGGREEVDIFSATSAGLNLGWPYMEGARVNKTPVPSGLTLTGPALQYAHGNGPLQGGSITGGLVYRGPIDSLNGLYIFADYVSKHIWTVSYDRMKAGPLLDGAGFDLRDADFTPNAGTINQPVAFGMDGAGSLYVVDLDGEIFRVDPAS